MIRLSSLHLWGWVPALPAILRTLGGSHWRDNRKVHRLGKGRNGLCGCLVVTVLLASSCACLLAMDGFPVGMDATADKPQSKLWHNDDTWWCILYDGDAGGFFYQLRENEWAQCRFPDSSMYPGKATRADVLWDGEKLFVLEWEIEKPKFYQYHFQSADGAYELEPGFPVELGIPSGHETLVLEKDSKGVLWIVFELDGTVQAVHSKRSDYKRWNWSGFQLGDSLAEDDIASIIAFDQQIGVFWSNQNSHSLHFRIHRDDALPEQWNEAEIVLKGPYLSDDHINLATHEGWVYAVTKTSVNDAGSDLAVPTRAQVILNTRSPEGVWNTWEVAPVSTQIVTRPIVVLDEENQEIYIFYRQGPAIVYKCTSMREIDFRKDPLPAIAKPGVILNNVTSTKQNVNSETGLVALATGSDQRAYHRFLPISTKPSQEK